MWRLAVFVIATFAVLAVACAAPAQAQEREWNSSRIGAFRARFVREVDGEAMFLREGRPLTVPLDELTAEDRQAIAQWTSPKAPGDLEAVRPDGNTPAGTSEAQSKVRSLAKAKTRIVGRDWTDVFGNRTHGTFVRVFDRNVLLRHGAVRDTLPFDSLSSVDQAYINQVLTEAGEQPLVPFSPPPNPAGAGAAPPLPFSGRPFPEPHFPEAQANGRSEGEGFVDPQRSQFFKELHQRQEDRRKEQAEFAQNNPVPGPTAPGVEPTPLQGMEDSPATASARSSSGATSTSARSSQSGTLQIDPKTMAELRPVVIFAGILLGLFAVLGVVMFIATTIASGNAPRGQRRLY